jgi:hypothetical protein
VTAPTQERWRQLTRRFRRDDDWLPRHPPGTKSGAPRGRARRVVRKFGAIIGWVLLVVASGLGLAGLVVGAVVALIVTINGSLP